MTPFKVLAKFGKTKKHKEKNYSESINKVLRKYQKHTASTKGVHQKNKKSTKLVLGNF